MKTIWKFTLEVTNSQVISLPIGSPILTVQTQRNEPCLWVHVESDAPRKEVTILTFGTGKPLPDNMNGKYVGTYQLDNGLVFHVFEQYN